jgi:transposase
MVRLATVGPELVVLAATGGVEITGARRPARLLRRQLGPDPRLRATIGRLAKTDRLDAALIARFAEQVRPEPRPVRGVQTQSRVRELVVRRILAEGTNWRVLNGFSSAS